MGDDLDILADLPSGSIHFDILTGLATHGTQGLIQLHISKEMQAWFLDRLAKDSIPSEAIESATLETKMNTDRIATDKKRVVSFDWRCHSRITTDEKTYESQLADQHTWHSRRQTTSKTES
jgi:hypothetical protein